MPHLLVNTDLCSQEYVHCGHSHTDNSWCTCMFVYACASINKPLPDTSSVLCQSKFQLESAHVQYSIMYMLSTFLHNSQERGHVNLIIPPDLADGMN